ncbi:MAG: Mediator of RNA polymerase II transcription subunit 7 [Watsoniomyces obsoletus]|nr:MAG: Mediator of RNA polymerase II transcription subunit 7 [Watsoniomyces obsoletus]
MRPWTFFSWITVVGLTVGSPLPDGQYKDAENGKRIKPELSPEENFFKFLKDRRVLTAGAAAAGISAYLVSSRRRASRVTSSSSNRAADPLSNPNVRPLRTDRLPPDVIDSNPTVDKPSTPDAPPPIINQPASGTVDQNPIAKVPSNPNPPSRVGSQGVSGGANPPANLAGFVNEEPPGLVALRKDPNFVASAPQWYQDFDRWKKMPASQRLGEEGMALLEKIKLNEAGESTQSDVEDCQRQKEERWSGDLTPEVKRRLAHKCRIEWLTYRWDWYSWDAWAQQEAEKRAAAKAAKASPESEDPTTQNLEFRLGDLTLPSISFSKPSINMAAAGSSIMRSIRTMPKPKFTPKMALIHRK